MFVWGIEQAKFIHDYLSLSQSSTRITMDLLRSYADTEQSGEGKCLKIEELQ